MKKKLLSALIIGAFVFGVGAINAQPVNAAYALAKERIDKTKEKFDKAKDKLDGNKTDRPEPPKDENGNPLPPPDRQGGDKSNRHEPPNN